MMPEVRRVVVPWERRVVVLREQACWGISGEAAGFYFLIWAVVIWVCSLCDTSLSLTAHYTYVTRYTLITRLPH